VTDRDRLDLLAELVALWDELDAELHSVAYDDGDSRVLVGQFLGNTQTRSQILRHLTQGPR
jgi:hypothetical protein